MVDEIISPAGWRNIEKISPSIIMAAGVGGAGSNAVNHMFELGIAEVSFMVCNTDRQALIDSPVPIKVSLGEGLGAGNRPEKAREAALERVEEIKSILREEQIKMIFVTAGMGGGTGTGAGPVIAKAAKDMGILTVGIVTLPFEKEGPIRNNQALEGLEQMRQSVDALLIIKNESIQEIYGKMKMKEAFGMANNILATGARAIAELITRPGLVNVDFADVRTVMSDSGIALMGSCRAGGEDRASQAALGALNSPLLNHNDIMGAKNILINITYGDEELTLDEAMDDIVSFVQGRAGNGANVIWGEGHDPSLGDMVEVTLVATGFNDASLETRPKSPESPESPDEQSAQGDRAGRWTPPAEPPTPQPRPGVIPGAQPGQAGQPGQGLSAQPGAQRPGTGAPQGPAQPQMQPPVPPQPQQTAPPRPAGTAQTPSGTNILKAEQGKPYPNIDELWNTPAYIRSRIVFSIRQAKGNTIKRDEQEPDAKTGSLFD